MISFLPRHRWEFLTLAMAVLGIACHPAVDPPAVPLYPNGATKRLPLDQIAHVSGPIENVDGQQVLDQGGAFDLLPGCHLIQLDHRPVGDSYSLSSGAYWSGAFPSTIYAIRMKAGARYVIQRALISDGQVGRVELSAREEQADGVVTDLFPVKSENEIAACKQTAANP